MLSRVASSLYWMARYLERAESGARFLSVTHAYAQELRGLSHAAADESWHVARQFVAPGDYDDESAPRTFHRLAFDESLPNSLISCTLRARENARGIRDAIPSEMWEELNVLFMLLREESHAPPSETSQISLLHRVRNASLVFSGLRDNTMTRMDEWHFLRLGNFSERADGTARMLRAMYMHPAIAVATETGHNIDTLHLAMTLRASTALEAYSRAHHVMEPETVAEFLLLDARFPHSVEFCVQEIGTSLHALSGTLQDVFTNEAEQITGRLVADLRFDSMQEIIANGLDDYLTGVLGKLAQLGGAIAEQYFS